MKALILVGALFAFLSVALGAFAAHGLRSRLSAEKLAVFQTGVTYQTTHAIALLIAGLIGYVHPAPALTAAGWLFVIGIVLFSGSLYTLSLTERRAVGAITPIGGLCFLAGWVAVAVSVL